MAKSFQREGVTDKVVFGVMGDSIVLPPGMTGAAEIIYNNGRMIPCVLDNRITGMTGHQDNPGSGFTLMGEPAPMISVEKVLEAYGFAPVFTVDPQDLTAMKKTVDDAVAALNEGKHPAIVTRRPCLLIKRGEARHWYVRRQRRQVQELQELPEGGLPRHLHGERQGVHRPYPVRGLYRLRPGLPLWCY